MASLIWLGRFRVSEGLTRGEFETTRVLVSYFQSNGIGGIALSYVSIGLGLFLRLESSRKDNAERLLYWAQNVAAFLLFFHVAVEAVLILVLSPDWLRLRGWTWLLPTALVTFGMSLVGPSACAIAWRLYRQNPVIESNRANREVKKSLIKLLAGSMVRRRSSRQFTYRTRVDRIYSGASVSYSVCDATLDI